MNNYSFVQILLTIFACAYFTGNAQSSVVIFSEQSGIKRSTFSLELSSSDPGRIIHYTTDGSIPTQSSPLYQNPIIIDQSILITALSFAGSVPDSLPSRSGYIFLAEDMNEFSSNLPVLIISNLGQSAIPVPVGGFFGGGDLVEKQFSVSALFEPKNGRTSLLHHPSMEFNSGIKVRGSSSATFPKKSFGYDIWDEQSCETDLKPLGMAKSADWVLHGSRNQDPTYIRSILPYELSNQMGQWAPGSVAIELYLHVGAGNVSQSDYLGIYFFMEKIGRGKDKVDIEKLHPTIYPSDPEISGGYIMKVDRLDAEAVGFECIHSADFGVTNYYSPKERNMPDYQKPWIVNYIAEFENALQQIPNNRNYTNYINVQSAIDHWILKAMPMDADAFVLSDFFYKDRYEPIKMGPIWDLDRSAGSVDTRTTNWNSWSGGALADFWNVGWYGYLHDDPEYYQALCDRWFHIRQQQLHTDNIDFIIDSLTNQMSEAMQRDIVLWPIQSNNGTFQGEMDHLKNWYHNRVNWIDQQLGYTPEFVNNSVLLTGNYFFIDQGYLVEMRMPQAHSGTIYYTTDGSDPRQEGGGIHSAAMVYNTSLSIPYTQTVRARSYNNGEWSCIRTATFYQDQDLSKLKITEIYYNPLTNSGYDNDELEFIELKNTGDGTLYLSGLSFTEGIEFTFPVNAQLAPGAFVVIASNSYLFEMVTGYTPDYEYEKQLSNGGEHLQLSDIAGNVVTEVEYKDNAPWPAAADGFGFSLVPVLVSPQSNQNDASQWRASSKAGGSPGADDVLLATSPVLISEVLANSQEPAVDAIELYNPNNETIDIGGWFLSDDSQMTKVWTIPTGTSIPAQAYITLYEGHYIGTDMQYSSNEFGASFSLSSHGDDVYIFATQNGNLTGYAHGFDLDESLTAVTYGPYETSTGESHIVPFKTPTLGAVNDTPRVGPLVIGAINYNPQNVNSSASLSEFVLITNISDSTVFLFDNATAQNTWQIKGISFSFPETISMAPQESIYVKNDELSNPAFRARYGLGTSVQLFTFIGALDNNGETIALEMPLQYMNNEGEMEVSYVVIDKVKYDNKLPWPNADGNGKMLQRINNGEYGNDPVNWVAVDGLGTTPDTYLLTVTGGTGSGNYAAFDEITITATIPQGKLFHQWVSSEAHAIDDVYSATSTFHMQAQDVEIVAEYRDIVTESLIYSGDMWYYNNKGIDLGTSWLTLAYDFSLWLQGATSLGMETGITTPIDIGPDNNRYTTIYFIKEIQMEDVKNISSATLGLLYDDGAVVYINGTEAFRVNMPGGTVNYSTLASSHEASAFEYFQIDPSLFTEGSNTIKVEIHNTSTMSSDLVFDLTLNIEKGVPLTGTDTQHITLKQGWNLISLSIEPDNRAIATLFPNALTVKNFDGFYQKDQDPSLNSLTELTVGNAFYIYNAVSEHVSIAGTRNTGIYVYNLNPGWNLIGVPRINNVDIAGTISADVEYIKDANDFYDATPLGKLVLFKPGQAYLVKTSISSYVAFDEE